MSVGQICKREVDVADAGESVKVAADRMLSRNVGTLVILNELKEPMGIVTDRDLTIRVLAQGKDPFQTTVEEVMSRFPAVVTEDTAIEEVLRIMRARSVRRLPVVSRQPKSEKLVGLVSVDDVIDLLVREFGEIGALLRQEGPSALSDA